jgi:hypothetical protein
MSDAPTSQTGPAAPHDAAEPRNPSIATDAFEGLAPDERDALRALAEAPPADVDGFAMRDSERWGALREGATGDLHSVIDAYRRLEGADAPAPAARGTDRPAPTPSPSPDRDEDEQRGRPPR